MDTVLVPKNWGSYTHAILPSPLLSYKISEEPNDLAEWRPPETCHTRRGEPLCSCGRLFLEWERGR